jgi:hypothetical protein
MDLIGLNMPKATMPQETIHHDQQIEDQYHDLDIQHFIERFQQKTETE